MCIQHLGSDGSRSFRAEYCTDCWTRWQNTRENLDGQSEYGVQHMNCPHCAMCLADSPAVYERKEPFFYEILVEDRSFHVSNETTLGALKVGILGSSLNRPTRFETEDDFDLYSEEDGAVLTGSYLLVPPGTVLRIEPAVSILRVVRGTIRITLYNILGERPLVAVLPADGALLRDLKDFVRTHLSIPPDYQRYTQRGRFLTRNDESSVIDLADGNSEHKVYLVRSLRGDIGEFEAESVWQLPPRPLDVIRSVREQRPEYKEGRPEFVAREHTILSEVQCQTLRSRLDLEDQSLDLEDHPLGREDETLDQEDQTLDQEDRTLDLEGQTLDQEDQTLDREPKPLNPDTKVRITVDELRAFVGEETLRAMLVLFGDSRPTEIILRRTRGTHGAPIPFHLDSALRTLQIPLNGQNEYTGGSTVFLLPEGPHGTISIPCRSAGASFTLHNAHVVHGVSPVETGIRDALFLLQKEPECSSHERTNERSGLKIP